MWSLLANAVLKMGYLLFIVKELKYERNKNNKFDENYYINLIKPIVRAT
jgi:hypothetical protein